MKTFPDINVLYNADVALRALHVEDDGLICPDVGGWAEGKYRLLALYDELFSIGMKNKWDKRVYIDLYAGAGYSRIRGTRTVLMGSPIIALTVPDPFDKYIFCEESSELMAGLKARVERIAPTANVTFVPQSCDSEIDRICAAIPKGSPSPPPSKGLCGQIRSRRRSGRRCRCLTQARSAHARP